MSTPTQIPNPNVAAVRRIIKPTDRIIRETLALILYGDPGAGKSTLSFSGGNALVLATDKGFYRAGNRGDALPIENWSDMDRLTKEDYDLIEPYDVLVIDTMGEMIKQCILSLATEPAHIFNRKTGMPSPQGWGMVKNRFDTWFSEMKGKKKSLIFIAHAKAVKKPGSDEMKMQPDVSGGSLAIVMRECDMMGYLYIGEDGQRVINWATTAYSEGKDPAGFGVQRVPLIPDEAPDFLGQEMKEAMRRISNISLNNDAVRDLIAKWKGRIDKLKMGDDLDELVDRVQQVVDDTRAFDLHPQKQIQKYLQDALPRLGLAYSSETKTFVPAPPKVEDTPPPTPPVADTPPATDPPATEPEPTKDAAPPADAVAQPKAEAQK